MHINELEIGWKLKRSLGGSDLANLLRQKGWTPLGFGFEAGVAEHPDKAYVLKIFPKNSPYTQFVQLVKSHAQNPHLPKFSRYVRHIPGTEYAYVRMEKLTKMKDYDLYNMPSLLCLLDKLYHKHGQQPPYWVRNNVSYDADSELMDCNQIQTTPEEQQAIDLLDQGVQQLGIDRLDLHSGNFMRRGNTWVITDPFI